MTLFLFRSLVFVAAFLLFSIQPLTGKEILPYIGGTPQGWLVTLAFFQTTLVGGYALVYLTRKLPVFVIGILFVALLAFGLLAFQPTAPLKGEHLQGLELLLWLWETRGLSLVALGATAPFVQRLFSSINPDNPYTLYAVSNIGSFLGLLAYPFLIEPFSGLNLQAMSWGAGYGLLIFLAACCVFVLRRTKSPEQTLPPENISGQAIAFWLALSALPASMLSGVTSLISANIASFPLLWVIPLAIYLATYVLAFGDRFVLRTEFLRILYFYVSILLIALSVIGVLHVLPFMALTLLVIFGMGAYLCHSRLYALRPTAANLPLFYLIIAFGGALGGAFNAFVAPILFNDTPEFYLALALTFIALGGTIKKPAAETRPSRWPYIVLCCGVVCAALIPHLSLGVALMLGVLLLLSTLLLIPKANLVFFLYAACLFFGTQQALSGSHLAEAKRNFFGVLRVVDSPEPVVRRFMHGTIVHGLQPLDPAYARTPLSYYSFESPAREVFLAAPAGPVAAVGLGTGQLACYQQARKPVTFFDIDPDVVNIAEKYFTYLAQCPVYEVILGDARHSIEQRPEMYTGIILDAFSGDAIPTHLLTREALEVYKAKLKRGGYILFHISNRYVSLHGILAAQARDLGWYGLHKLHDVYSKDKLATPSEWFVITANPQLAETLNNNGWGPVEPTKLGWTDDRFSLMPILRFAPRAFVP